MNDKIIEISQMDLNIIWNREFSNQIFNDVLQSVSRVSAFFIHFCIQVQY
jgi:hypothetical protein